MISPSRIKCRLPPSSMSLTCHSPIACQHNWDKSSAPLCQNQYHSKVHTSPDKRGASTKGKPTPNNQCFPKVSQEKKNGKNTPSYNFSYSSITAPILWAMLIKNLDFSRLKKQPCSQGTLGNTFNALYGTRTLQRLRPVPLKYWHKFTLKWPI